MRGTREKYLRTVGRLAELARAAGSELEQDRDRARATLTKIRGIVVAHSKGIGSSDSAVTAIASILHVRAPRRPR